MGLDLTCDFFVILAKTCLSSDVGDQPPARGGLRGGRFWVCNIKVCVMAGNYSAREGSRVALAEKLCVVVFKGRKVRGRYRMPFDDVVEASKLSFAAVVSGLTAAIKQDWITQTHDTVELKAAGIHIAKKKLDILG
jgi:hypothetical protein